MSKAAEDLSKQEFGRLTVRYMSPKRKQGHRIAICDCACGREGIEVRASSLRADVTTSCGCALTESRKNGIPVMPGFQAVQPFLEKICLKCGADFKIEISPRRGITRLQAEKMTLCDKCRLKKALGTRLSKDDW